MGLKLTIVCDRCGFANGVTVTGDEMVSAPAAIRVSRKRLRARGWVARKKTETASFADFCPRCAPASLVQMKPTHT